MRLILASGSPRRKELLTAAGYVFDVVRPNDEAETGMCSNCGPAELVAELALAKAADVLRQLKLKLNREVPEELPSEEGELEAGDQRKAIVLAADTVAECDGHILGKPKDEEHARRMLQTMAGREHRVYTGVCLWMVPDGGPATLVVVTKLKMDALSDDQLDGYLASGGWRGKAGAFGYQDRLGWVRIVDGSESNVVGLPMEMVKRELTKYGCFANTTQ